MYVLSAALKTPILDFEIWEENISRVMVNDMIVKFTEYLRKTVYYMVDIKSEPLI